MRQSRRAVLGVLAGPFLAAAMPPAAASAEQPGKTANPLVEPFEARLAKEQLVQDIGWRLVTGNAPYCASTVSAIGLQLHDMASYGNPPALRELLGLKSDIAVLTVAKGSPAEVVGLTTNQDIAAIDHAKVSEWPADSNRDWRRAKRAHDWIDARLAETGAVTLTFADGQSLSAKGREACPSRFELGGETKRAVAEGSRVIIGLDFPGFDYAEDEFAAAIAHELAHNLLKHREWLGREGRTRRNIRLTEREADRLMPWLLANAGYDPGAAIRFMQRWGPKHGGGIFRKRTHDGWDERVEFIDAERAVIAELQEEEGVDWRRHFVREIAQP